MLSSVLQSAIDSKSAFLDRRGSRSLVVAFGSFGGEQGAPGGFAFRETLLKTSVDYLLLKDENSHWYCDGATGFGSQEATAAAIQSLAADYDRCLVIGSSMGGFGALKYGNMAEVDQVLAFSPQVFTRSSLRMHHKDSRWGGKISEVQAKMGKEWSDLSDDKQNARTRFAVVHGGMDRLDSVHVSHLREKWAVSSFEVLDATHANAAQILRRLGALVGSIEAFSSGADLGSFLHGLAFGSNFFKSSVR